MAGGEVKFPLVDNHWFKAVIIYICLSSWKHRFSFCLLFQLPFCYSMTLHYTLTHLPTFMETVKKKRKIYWQELHNSSSSSCYLSPTAGQRAWGAGEQRLDFHIIHSMDKVCLCSAKTVYYTNFPGALFIILWHSICK